MISESQLADHLGWGMQGKRLTPEQGTPILSMLAVISVIDDDAFVRAATDNLLSSHGYLVHTFASAEEFLRSVHVNSSSCVVADVQMPAMSGLDLLTHMRSEGYNAPFIFITAFPDEGVHARALKAGAACFLAKPFGGPALIGCIEAALNQHRCRASK
jgi:FixJ family two-component response regulator